MNKIQMIVDLRRKYANLGLKQTKDIVEEICNRIISEGADHKTLRDEFAMAALNGLGSRTAYTVNAVAASEAYKLADAMLEARKVKP